MKTIDGQRLSLKIDRSGVGVVVKAVVGGSVVWGERYQGGETDKQIRRDARSQLESIGIVNDE